VGGSREKRGGGFWSIMVIWQAWPGDSTGAGDVTLEGAWKFWALEEALLKARAEKGAGVRVLGQLTLEPRTRCRRSPEASLILLQPYHHPFKSHLDFATHYRLQLKTLCYAFLYFVLLYYGSGCKVMFFHVVLSCVYVCCVSLCVCFVSLFELLLGTGQGTELHAEVHGP
jgi:hypothetical protein